MLFYLSADPLFSLLLKKNPSVIGKQRRKIVVDIKLEKDK